MKVEKELIKVNFETNNKKKIILTKKLKIK